MFRVEACAFSLAGWVLTLLLTQAAPCSAAPPADLGAREARERFYDEHPTFRGREKCVARAFDALTEKEKTWDNLARTAASFCVAPPAPLDARTPWVEVTEDVDGRHTFVDEIEVRADGVVIVSELGEMFSDHADFLLVREAFDCDRKQ